MRLNSLISDEAISNRIYIIRDQKIMLDRDLAELYGVETKRLKEAVRRNIQRFPEDFMFELTNVEFERWRSQFASSKEDKKGLRYAPFCFTEQGVAMLSSVLNSARAIAVNIQIIRVFTRMRQIFYDHKEILVRLEKIEKNLMKNDAHIRKHEEEIQMIFKVLKKLLNPEQPPRKKIGYKRKDEKN